MYRFLLVFISIIVCSSCAGTGATRTGSLVDKGIVLRRGGQHYEVRENQIFLAASTVGEPALPAYPQELVGMALPTQRVCVELTISTDGAVTAVKPVADVPECPSLPPRAEFVQAVLDRVQTWQFFAAAICTFPEGVKKNDRCEGAGVSEVPVPIRLIYYFDFSLQGGRPVIRTGTSK